MVNSKKIEQLGGINTDVNYRVMPNNDYITLENMGSAVNEYASGLSLKNVPASVLKYDDYPEGTNKWFGSCTDGLRIFWFNWNSNGAHGIYCYDESVDTYYIVVLSTQIAGGLNWDINNRIFKNARALNGLLTATENVNEIYEFNIEAGIKLNQPSYDTDVEPYATPILATSVTLIKRPPETIINAEKLYDAGFTSNFVKDNAYQFAFRYQYKNYEYSALSPWSVLLPFNFETDNFNYTKATIPIAEFIDDYIQTIEICVRRGNYAQSFIIKTFDKDNAADLAAIALHNAETTPLSFSYYDDFIGEALDSVTANTAFHLVPNRAKTLEIAKNRVMLSNITGGYDTPSESSLSLTSISYDTGTISRILKSGGIYNVRVVFFDQYRRKTGVTNQNVSVVIPGRTTTQTGGYAWKFTLALSNVNPAPEIPIEAWYYSLVVTKEQTREGFVETYPKSISYATKDIETGLVTIDDATEYTTDTYALAVDISELFGHSEGYIYNKGDYGILYSDTTNLKLNVLGQQGNYVLLQPKDIGFLNHLYHSIVKPQNIAYDNSQSLYITFEYSENSIASIVCQTQTVGTLDIPNARDSTNWIFNVTDGKRYFCRIACELKAAPGFTGSFVVKIYMLWSHPTLANVITLLGELENNGEDGTISINKTVTVPVGYTKGFIYSECSTTTLTPPTVFIESAISFLFLDSDYQLIELYTPYKHSENEPYFENGSPIPVLNPGTPERQYTVISNMVITGDCYKLTRTVFDDTDYVVESMSPNDTVWQRWERDLGWQNFIDKIGKTNRKDDIIFSDTFINGSRLNGNNVFQPLNFKNVGSSTGEIKKIQLTKKQQEDGYVLLILTERQSMGAYLGEIQLVASAQNSGSPIQSTEVIGTINPHKKSRGTLHPESVIEYHGQVWWVDAINRKFCQYSDNGVEDISDHGLNRFALRYFNSYMKRSSAEIQALCGFSHISSGVDASTGRVFFVLPQVEDASFQPNLEGYTEGMPTYTDSIKNRFDLSYNLSKPHQIFYSFEENKWKEVSEWFAEGAEYIGANLYGFKAAALWKHHASDTVFNTIYGTEYPQRICFVVNSMGAVNDIIDLALEANGVVPTYSVAYSTYPNIQITDLVDTDFVDEEGHKYASWLFDRLSPNGADTQSGCLYDGDIVKGSAILVMLEFTVYDKPFEITFIDIGYLESEGHSQVKMQKA